MLTNNYSYIPILSLKPAEMAALEELPSKDKDLILPLISLKKWANSKSFIKSTERIKKAFGQNWWIADIDKEFLSLAKQRVAAGEDKVSSEFIRLADPNDGYRNWVDFIASNDNVIPAIQFNKISELEMQLNNFLEINRTIVARFELSGIHSITSVDFSYAIKSLSEKKFPYGLVIILDHGDFNRFDLIEYHKYSSLVKQLHNLISDAFFCVSGTSFPYSFAGSYRGEIPIYERQIYNKIVSDCQGIKLIYSDRASTRALVNDGGSGLPPPRIDYPLKNDWRFIRKELNSDSAEKEELYQEAAIEMMKSDYWNAELRLWGTQMIEKTSLGDPYGITSANRATAVRINLHIYQQLHYYDTLSSLDTEEDWVD
ncbi:beta family protein [Yersinia enterocolitica]